MPISETELQDLLKSKANALSMLAARPITEDTRARIRWILRSSLGALGEPGFEDAGPLTFEDEKDKGKKPLCMNRHPGTGGICQFEKGHEGNCRAFVLVPEFG